MGDVPAAFAVAPPVGGSGKHRNRVYETWQGNERFFCWGYLMAGPNWRAVFGTAFLVAAPTGIFLAFVASYLLFEVNAALMVFACILPALSLLFLFMTACRDPGVIARQEPDEEYLAGRKPRTKELFVNNQRVLIRYNDTCHFYQPPRAHHCSVNDNCIERFDHHCPWVGTTIGRRNYRTFLLFIYTTTVLCLYVMGCCLAQLFVKHGHLADDARAAGSTHQQWGATVRHVIPALVLLGYTFLLFWFVGGLSMFHCYLVARNQTTYENFRYTHDSRPNPYSRGIFGNCADVWCTPLPPSHVDFRAYVDEAVHRPPVYPEGDAGDPPTDGGGGGGADGGGGGGGNGAPYPAGAHAADDGRPSGGAGVGSDGSGVSSEDGNAHVFELNAGPGQNFPDQRHYGGDHAYGAQRDNGGTAGHVSRLPDGNGARRLSDVELTVGPSVAPRPAGPMH